MVPADEPLHRPGLLPGSSVDLAWHDLSELVGDDVIAAVPPGLLGQQGRAAHEESRRSQRVGWSSCGRGSGSVGRGLPWHPMRRDGLGERGRIVAEAGKPARPVNSLALRVAMGRRGRIASDIHRPPRHLGWSSGTALDRRAVHFSDGLRSRDAHDWLRSRGRGGDRLRPTTRGSQSWHGMTRSRMTPRRALWLLIVVSAALRLLWAASLGPGNDEAYHYLSRSTATGAISTTRRLLAVVEAVGIALARRGLPVQPAARFRVVVRRLDVVHVRLTARFYGERAGLLAAFALNVTAYHTAAAGPSSRFPMVRSSFSGS